RRRGEFPLEALLEVQRGHLRQAGQPLQAALDLACLARLRAKAGDEALDSGALTLLAGQHRLGALGLRGALRLEGAVIARIGARAAGLDVQDAPGHAVEEFP